MHILGAGKSANRITTVESFSSAQIVKVDPDKPLEDVRFLSLVFRKKLLVPSPRLQSGLFNLLWNDSEDDMESLRNKVQYEGIKNHSIPLDLNIKIKVDVIVSGAVAVSLTGRRIGKGEGFADLEYALMKNMNIINDNTFVIAMVHDCQVFDELPSHLFQEHDVPIDVIVTPTQIIYTKHTLPKPEGIYWHLLPEEKIKQIPILTFLQKLPKNSFFNNERNLTPSLHSASFNPGNSSHFEGYDKRREHISAHKPNRGRNPFNYNREQRPYNNYNRERNESNYEREQRNSHFNDYKYQDTQNSYPKRKEKPYGSQSRDSSKSEKNDNGHIHVNLLSVDKRNHIVHRTVEESNELDRIGDANETTEVAQAQPQPPGEREKNTILLSTFTDLREELKKRDVKPTYISWKGFDYAFLDFKNSLHDVSDILQSLKDLSFRGKLLKVNHKQYSKDKSNQDEGMSQRNKNLGETSSSTNISPKKTVKSTECQKDKTKKTDSQKVQNINTQTKQVSDSSLNETKSSTNTPTKKTEDSIECQSSKTADSTECLGSKTEDSTECKGSKTADSTECLGSKTEDSTECLGSKTADSTECKGSEPAKDDTQIKHCNSSENVIESQNNNTKDNEDGWKLDNQDTPEDGWGPIERIDSRSWMDITNSFHFFQLLTKKNIWHLSLGMRITFM
ncbi:Methenyltetrahydrofolate synthase domain-containing protein [Armadillidium vulgare]|nr:Methenyltetrahydrofolate synthase domain-containing protein [Armadillidium vulgare]